MEAVRRNHRTIGSLLGEDMEEERGQLYQMVQDLPQLIAQKRWHSTLLKKRKGILE
jgi:hypothetical protein